MRSLARALVFLFCAFSGGAFAQIVGGSIFVNAIQQIVPGAIQAGSGSPAGTVSCTARCLYIRTDGGAGTTLYINETGGGTSGWAAK